MSNNQLNSYHTEHDKIQRTLDRIISEVFVADEGIKIDGLLWIVEYLNQRGITYDNYPFYMRLLSINNHWISDKIFGEADPFFCFDQIDVNGYIVKRAFEELRFNRRGGIYEKNLLAYLGILKRNYTFKRDALSLHEELSIEDINAIAKYLDFEAGPQDNINVKVLLILDIIAGLHQHEPSGEVLAIVNHAREIIVSFYTPYKGAHTILPEDLTIPDDYKNYEVSPR